MAAIDIRLEFEDGTRSRQDLELPVLVGRDTNCDLVINSWRVAKQHAKLLLRQNDLWLEDLGSIMGTTVNGNKIASYGPVTGADLIVIGNCRFQIELLNTKQPSINKLAEPETEFTLAGNAVDVQHTGARPQINHEQAVLRKKLHTELISALQLKRRDISNMSNQALRAEAYQVLSAIISQDQDLSVDINKDLLIRQLIDEAVGLGPLEPLLADPGISEIMVNRYDEVFVERAGKIEPAAVSFSSEQSVQAIVDRIVAPIGRRIDDSSPMVDARLQDGSRVNAVITPLSLRGISLTIRKFPQKSLAMADLLAVGTLDQYMAEFLNICVQTRKNILVSGGTGTGKTSLLNILSNAITNGERIITIEDAAELRLNHNHLVSLEARPANSEGRGKIEIRDLVRNSLRMRPDRIVVGECRGAEAFDMLSAMNTGHEGSLTTLHANSPRDALSRLETMVLMAGMDLPLIAIREHIASAVDIIIQLTRLSDGRRIVSSIVQVSGIESGRIQLQDLFTGSPVTPSVFRGCGLMPNGFAQTLNPEIFNQETVVHGQSSLQN